jgi:hypothetical protein
MLAVLNFPGCAVDKRGHFDSLRPCFYAEYEIC